MAGGGTPGRPVGIVTRRTTNPNRLRRVDRWLAGPQARRLRRADDPVVVRALNVLRQYDEDDVGPAWAVVRGRLAPHGLLVDGTCDEIGRRCAWVAVTREDGPVSLTLSLRLAGLVRPSDVARRLPKALIRRNVPGERVHALLGALDEAWARAAHHATFGARQRWLAAVAAVRADGWPVLDGPSRWRLGEVTVGWEAVRP